MFTAALLIGGFVALAVYGVDRNNVAQSAMARAELASAVLAENTVPDFDGYTLTVLCDSRGSDAFALPRENETALSRAVVALDRHLAAETGVTVRAVAVPDFLAAAREDLLSGDGSYELYAASAKNGLAPLLVSGGLAALSEDSRLSLGDGGYNLAVMDALALYGRTYLISSAALGGCDGVYCVAFNRKIEEELSTLFPDGQRLTAAALDGTLTFEQLALAARAAKDTQLAQQETAAVAEIDAVKVQDDFCGLALDRSSLFPLAFGMGGGFVLVGRNGTEIAEYDKLCAAQDGIRSLLADGTATLVGDVFGEGGSLYGITKLGDMQKYKATLSGVGLLPMPKNTAAEPYRCYLDLDATALFALPAGADVLRTTYLVDRAVFLARGYIEPLWRRGITGENAEDDAVLTLIEKNIGSDLSGLFGYGDIPSLYAALAEEGGTPALHLEYYNRKALYEKALSIIEKRLN